MADMRERLIITANIANSRELASDDRLIWDNFLRTPLAGRSRFTLTPDRIVSRQEGCVVAEHPRCYGRGETIYDLWHYVPILGSVGIPRNGAGEIFMTAAAEIARKTVSTTNRFGNAGLLTRANSQKNTLPRPTSAAPPAKKVNHEMAPERFS